MGNKIAVTENGVHKIGKKMFLTDENSVYRKAKKAFLTKDGVHKLVFSSGVIWEKWDCLQEVTYVYEQTTDGVGSITTDSLNWDDTVYGDYSFWEYGGFEGAGSNYQAGHSDGTVSDWVVGKYIVYETEVYEIISLDNENGDVTCEIIAVCEEYEENTYRQLSTMYGTVEAEEGELPEEGTLVDGSPTGAYCVLYLTDDYYYYVRGE